MSPTGSPGKVMEKGRAETWHMAIRMLKSFSAISPDQEKLLYDSNSSYPSLTKQKFPSANVPASVLGQISEKADRELESKIKPDQVVAKDSATSAAVLERQTADKEKLMQPATSPQTPQHDPLPTPAAMASSPISGWEETPSPSKKRSRNLPILPPDSSAPAPPSFSSRAVGRAAIKPSARRLEPDGLPPSSSDEECDERMRPHVASHSKSITKKTELDREESDDDDVESVGDEMESVVPYAMGEASSRAGLEDSPALKVAVRPVTLVPSNHHEATSPPVTAISLVHTPGPRLRHISSSVPHSHKSGEQESPSHSGDGSSPLLARQSLSAGKRRVQLDSEAYLPTQVTCPFTSSKSDPVVPSTHQPKSDRLADPRLTQSFNGIHRDQPALGSSRSSFIDSPSDPTDPKTTLAMDITPHRAEPHAITPSIVHVQDSPEGPQDGISARKRNPADPVLTTEPPYKQARLESSYPATHDPTLDIASMKSRFLSNLCEERGLYHLFCEAYPTYKVSEIKFNNICNSKLNSLQQRLPEGLYDDYIIKYTTLYEPYEIECFQQDQTPATYIEFYKKQAGPVHNNQFVVNTKTLKLHLERVGDAAVSGATDQNDSGQPMEEKTTSENGGKSIASPLSNFQSRRRRGKKRQSPLLTEYVTRYTGLKSNRKPDGSFTHSWRL